MNIGIFGLWGFSRGHVNINKQYVDAFLENNDNVFVFNLNTNKNSKEFDIYNDKIHITQNSLNSLFIPKEIFKEWIKLHNLDAIFFNEYNQWENDGQNLIKIANDMNVKTYGILVWEKFDDRNLDEYNEYNRLLPSTKTFYRLMRQHKLRKKTLIPYSLDLNEYPLNIEKRKKFTFIHIGGFLGVHQRKNTNAVLTAFKEVNKKYPNTELIITNQTQTKFPDYPNVIYPLQDLNRKDLISLLASCHVSVLPSKWETIGIPILESMACNIPVITTNSPPMNELVVDTRNGLCVGVENYKRYPGISVLGAEVNIQDLINKMCMLVNNELIYNIMCSKCRKHIEEYYDWNKNKQILLEMIKND
jgi:1,2-diacylglycerol 3-alpha-glucosyltransferase